MSLNPHPLSTGINTEGIGKAGKPVPRRRLRAIDFNHAVKLQHKGLTMREIADVLALPLGAVQDELYWDMRK